MFKQLMRNSIQRQKNEELWKERMKGKNIRECSNNSVVRTGYYSCSINLEGTILKGEILKVSTIYLESIVQDALVVIDNSIVDVVYDIKGELVSYIVLKQF